MGPRLAPAAVHLLRLQRDLIADWQARELGIPARTLRRACGVGWQQHGYHVFADRTGEPTDAQRRMIAFLEFGPTAVLTGRAALAEHGWTLAGGDPVDLAVPRDMRGRLHPDLPWLRVHTTLAPLPSHSGHPPRTGAARSAIDAAAWARTAREVLLIVTSTVQQRLALPGQLASEAGGRPRLRHRRWIDEALVEVAGGATTTTEADFRRECRRRGLPAPRMQTRRVDAHGRLRRTDAELVLPDGRRLIVEIDGVGHMQVDQWRADLVRQNALTVATGALTLRVTGWEVRNDPDPFFDLLTALFRGDVMPHAS